MSAEEAIASEISAKLRGYQGAQDFARLRECPNLLQALGTADAAEAYQRLKAVFTELAANRDLEALRNAMNIDPVKKGNLGERRAEFGRRNDRTAGAVKAWEAKGIAVLARYLASRARLDAEVVRIEISVDVHDLVTTRVVVARTLRGGDGATFVAREEANANPGAENNTMMFILRPDERPASLSIIINWSGVRPNHHWIYEYDSVLSYSVAKSRGGVHYPDKDHYPMPGRTQRDVDSPVPGTVYVAIWPAQGQDQGEDAGTVA